MYDERIYGTLAIQKPLSFNIFAHRNPCSRLRCEPLTPGTLAVILLSPVYSCSAGKVWKLDWSVDIWPQPDESACIFHRKRQENVVINKPRVFGKTLTLVKMPLSTSYSFSLNYFVNPLSRNINTGWRRNQSPLWVEKLLTR